MSTTTMKTIQTTKRLYCIASPPAKASPKVATRTHLRRPRANSASASSSPPSSSQVGSPGSSDRRTLYTNAASGSNPLHYFDSGAPPPPPPPPTSRPGNPHVVSTHRPPSGESQTTHGSPPHASQQQGSNSGPNAHPQGQQSHTHGQSQPLLGSTSYTLNLTNPASPSGSSPSERSFVFNGPRGAFAGQPWSPKTSSGVSPSAQDAKNSRINCHQQRIYQLDVGAYGIPKRRRERVAEQCFGEEEDFAMSDLDMSFQVGEDAYFVREDAMGVADGVGGWNSRKPTCSCAPSASSAATPSSSSATPMRSHRDRSNLLHRQTRPSQLSPSALFARRLMHFCALEVGEAQARLDASHPPLSTPPGIDHSTSMRSPSSRNGGMSPRSPTLKNGRKVDGSWGNARPFAWPWEEPDHSSSISERAYPEFTLGMDSLLEEDVSAVNTQALEQDQMAETLGAEAMLSDHVVNEGSSEDETVVDVVDPVDVLERAYNRAIQAHKRRVFKIHEKTDVVEKSVAERTGDSFWNKLGLNFSTSLTFSERTSSSSPLPSTTSQGNGIGLTSGLEWEPLLAGSSTALLAVLSGDRLRIAHLGDCSGLLVRNGEVAWRSEEMWWGFNYPLQLGPSSPTQPQDARSYELRVQKDDILILASDGMSDNLWEEDVLDEVKRFAGMHLPSQESSAVDAGLDAGVDSGYSSSSSDGENGLLGRRTLAGLLSEALCSRARRVSEQARAFRDGAACGGISSSKPKAQNTAQGEPSNGDSNAEEVPFARRAREEGKSFRGGKSDDISVLVAVISPVAAP